MKKFIAVITSTLIMIFFTQCGSAQFDKEAPFTISKASYQDWFGGQPGSKGTLISLELSGQSNKIIFDSIFYKNQKSKLDKVDTDSIITIKGNFITASHHNRNIIMHSDPKEEMANTMGAPSINNPFELTDKECVISYFVNKKKYYYKLENLKKEKPLYYP